MRIRTVATAAVMSLIGLTAFAQDVKVDFDKSADFSAIRTFSTKLGTSWNNQISEKRILTEIDQTLVEKGWKKDDANPDAVVVVHGATQTKRSLNTFYSGGGYGGYGYRGWGGGMGMGTSTTTESEYLVGTLVVDIFNSKTKALLFRGTASDEISDKPEKNIKKVDKAADKMFKDFPPGSKKK
jgi:hypothetical protein